MHSAKGEYLKKLTEMHPMPSVGIRKTLEGTSPPSVFIGSWNYPKVYAGPMISPARGDIRIIDTPESWIPEGISQDEIIRYRMSLVRGKRLWDVRDLSGRFAEQLRDIALSSISLESEVVFSDTPRGGFAGEHHTPFGPSGYLDSLETSSAGWIRGLEKVYDDTDLTARDAMVYLHAEGFAPSLVQKALSAGVMGRERDRRLVPTRWAITAFDTIIGNHLLSEVRNCEIIDSFHVHEFSSLHNHYAVILLPVPWEFEWIEAFLHEMAMKRLFFLIMKGTEEKESTPVLEGATIPAKWQFLRRSAERRSRRV